MMTAIDFAVRNLAGSVQAGSVAGPGQGNFIQVGSGDSVSLNLSSSSIISYTRQGGDLVIALADGRMIVLAGYFFAQNAQLYLSAEDEMAAVSLADDGTGVLLASYAPVQGGEKWSPLDNLRFSEPDMVMAEALPTDEPAGMGLFAPAALAGGLGAGAIGAGALGLGLIGVGGGGGDDTTGGGGGNDTTGGGGGNDTTGGGGGNDTTGGGGGNDTTGGGGGNDTTGGGGGNDTTGGGGGNDTTGGGGGNDTTGGGGDGTPEKVAIAVTEGTKTAGHVENIEGFKDGVTIGGTASPNADIVVTIEGAEQTTTADDTGNWSVTFPPGTITGGEREPVVEVTATLGNQTSTLTEALVIDTVPHALSIHSVTSDNTVSGRERDRGFTISGSTEPGAEVTISFAGQDYSRTADENGDWSVDIAAGGISAGTYEATVTATTRDAANNPSSTTRRFDVDTETAVAFGAGDIAGNNIVNQNEAGRGITMTGTSEPGSAVSVTWGTTTLPAESDPVTGAWTVRFTQAQIPADGSTTVTVTATDRFENTATDRRTVLIDTRVEPLTRVSLGAGTDDVVNQEEARGGITITGTVEHESTVMVSFGGGAAIPARVTDGTWSVDIPEADIPTGQASARLTVTATDANGNTRIHAEDVAVDRQVINFAPAQAQLAGDGILNAQEAAAGLLVSGTAEARAAIVIRIAGGGTAQTTADDEGRWSTLLTGSALPRGEIQTTLTVTATDRAKNVSSYTQTLEIDTIAPGAPDLTGFTRDERGLTRIQTDDPGETYRFTRLDADGNQTAINSVRTVDEVFGTQNVTFGSFGPSGFVATPVPDGSYLVVNTTDRAGNDSSTLFVVNNTNAPQIDLGRDGLDAFTLTAIDLTFAPDARLTITETDILALTGPDRTLVIKGGADDRVSLAPTAQIAGTEEIDGENFTIFTLGPSGARVFIDDDIPLN